MAQQDDIPTDEALLADERWEWALRLLGQLLDDEPAAGDESGEPAEEPPAEAGGEAEESATGTAGWSHDPDDPAFDHLTGDAGDDLLDGMAGGDSLSGGGGDDILDGGDGADRLEGGSGDDMLLGQAGNDDLAGGGGDDDVGGDGGDDRLTGGRGSDVFSFDLMAAGSPGTDTVTDFARGEDILWIMGDNARWQALDSDGNGILDDADLAVSVEAGGMRVRLDEMHAGVAGAAVILQGVAELDRGDVVLVDL